MRAIRINALAVDFGVLPKHPGPASIQKFLETKLELDIAKLQSLQIHSTRGIVYVGLPEHLPAAAIANHHHLQHQILHDGKQYHIPVLPADDEAVDVRVYDLPPEIPNDTIVAEFRQYGQVLAITEELWRNFFPGIKSGVRVLRMRVSHPIPRHVAIPNTILEAHVRYPGQTRKRSETAAAPKPRKPESEPVPVPAAENKKFVPARTPEATIKQPSTKQKQNNTSQAHRTEEEQPLKVPSPVEEKSKMQAQNEEADNFTIVCRNKFKRQQSSEEAKSKKRFFVSKGDRSSDSELDDEVLQHMTVFEIFERGGSKRDDNIMRLAKFHQERNNK